MTRPDPLAAFRALRTLPRSVWVLSAAAFVNRLGMMALPFLTLFLIRERGYATTEAGLFLSLYGATALVAAPTSGGLVDRFGAKPVMVASFCSTGVFVACVPWARGTASLAALVVLWALSNEIFRPAMMARLTAGVAPEQHKQAFALNRWGVNLGMSVGPALGGVVAAHSFKLVFLIDGVTTLIAVACIAALLEPTPPSPRAGPRRTLPFSALGDPLLAAALLGLLPLCVLFFQIDSTLSVVMVQFLKMDPAYFGLIATLNTLLIVAAEIPLNHATAAWSTRRTMVVGALFTAAGFAIIGAASGFALLVASTVLWTIGEMVTSPGISAHISRIAPPDRRGEYMGLFMMTWSVAFMVAPWAGTQLLAQLGPRGVWPALGSLGLLSALVYARGAPSR